MKMHPIVLAILIAAAHVFLVQIVSEGSFMQSDTAWYSDIATHGYRHTEYPPRNIVLSPEKMQTVTNVAFFPGYPVVAKLIQKILPIETLSALRLTSWLALIGFWTYFLLLLKRWSVSKELSVLAVVILAAHPAAFFLVVAYSESLFMFAMLGWLYWSYTTKKYSTVLAVIHGFLMTTVRLVGILLPPLASGMAMISKGNWKKHTVIAIGSLMGCASFLVFCLIKFNMWNLYFLTQQAGWGASTNLLFIKHEFALDMIIPGITRLWSLPQNPTYFYSFLILPITTWLGVILMVWGLKKRKSLPKEFPIILVGGWLMYGVHAAGMIDMGFRSMLRHAYATHVFFVLALVLLLKTRDLSEWKWAVYVLSSVLLLALGNMQFSLIKAFTSGVWVA